MQLTLQARSLLNNHVSICALQSDLNVFETSDKGRKTTEKLQTQRICLVFRDVTVQTDKRLF